MKPLPDRMIIVSWKVRSGIASCYYYNNQSGHVPDQPHTKIKLDKDRRTAMKMYADLEGRELPRDVQTVEAAYELFCSHPRGMDMRAPKTQQGYRENWRAMAPVFGAADWDSIERVDAIAYLDKRSAKRAGNGEIKFLSLLWQFALNRGLTTRPNQLVKMEYHRLKPRDRYVGDAEYQRLRLAAPRPVSDAMRLMYLTGQRPSDTLRLTWDDVGEFEGEVWIDCYQSKVKKAVRVTARPELLEMIRELRSRPVVGIRLVCDDAGQTINLRWLQDALRATAKAAGVKNVRPSDFRSKSASDDHEGATKRLGHTTEAITNKVYIRTPKRARSTK